MKGRGCLRKVLRYFGTDAWGWSMSYRLLVFQGKELDALSGRFAPLQFHVMIYADVNLLV